MKIYLISNNSLLEHISYNNNSSLDLIRMVRPLSSNGEDIAKKISDIKELEDTENIYSSLYSSAISTSKYLAKKLELNINITEEANECVVGHLGSKNMKMVKGLQDHDFTYKLPNGESLNDVGNRIDIFIKKLINKNENCCVFTHKRAILGFLLKYAKVGYNLDENLILQYNDNVV